ncbi:hypothetical protein SYNPS1DRAFT_30005 [Syncephalis pseudoplumigaleata]|uniref:Zinc finger PHD-type domain-containing protein n=1 Tax=Syncephalis pseudoplumigaleata TaxID=1712513 RepID=A0A4V1J190_9FUNG|nr:hypothetical protein SYNPS1DRAFT_30005 [Syncephalis pseudoplumigaleata]|eukprot:RKP24229.1 hypothetical protein SYNPS1DRAFT_30005 [Syncephalis pseudoplumigaleata]
MAAGEKGAPSSMLLTLLLLLLCSVLLLPSQTTTRRRNNRNTAGNGSAGSRRSTSNHTNDTSKSSMEPERLEGDSDSDVINCVCGDDLYDGTLMIQCDRCYCWQHGICVGIKSQEACPDFYLCTECQDQELVALARGVGQPQRSGTRVADLTTNRPHYRRSRRPSGGNQADDDDDAASSTTETGAAAHGRSGSHGASTGGTSSGPARARRSREPEPQSSRRGNAPGSNGRSRRQRSSDDEPSSRRDTDAMSTTSNGRSDEAAAGTSSRRKRKTDTSEDGDDMDDTSMDETNHQQRPRKKANSDHSGDDTKGKSSTSPSGSGKDEFDMAIDASSESAQALASSGATTTGSPHGSQQDATLSASHLSTPKRARRAQRSGPAKLETHGTSGASGSGAGSHGGTGTSTATMTAASSINAYAMPSYRPRVWTGRTSLEDLRRRAQQIEGYIRRLQQDMDHTMSQASLPGSVAQSPSDTLLQGTMTTMMVASPESVHDESMMASRSVTPDASGHSSSGGSMTMSMVDMELLEGIEALLTQPSTEQMDTKFEQFPYSCLLEGVRRTAVAFLDRHGES